MNTEDTVYSQETVPVAEELAGEEVFSHEMEFLTELKDIGEKILRFFVNIGTSGKYWNAKDLNTFDNIIRYVVFNFSLIIGVVSLVIFAVENVG